MASPGQYLYAGFSSAGQSLAQGMQEYAKVKQQDAMASGQIDAWLQNQSKQGGTSNVSDKAADLATKFQAGKATLMDKMQLLGTIQTDQQISQQNQQRQLQQQQILAAQNQNNNAGLVSQGMQQQLQAGNIANQSSQLQLQGQQGQAAALQRLLAPQQQPGGGAPAPGGQPQQPPAQQPGQVAAQGGMGSAMKQFAQDTAQTFGRMPTADEMSRFAAQVGTQKTPAGVIYQGPTLDKDTGKPVTETYNRVYKNGYGNAEVDNTPITVPYGSPPPGQLLNSSTYAPVGGTNMVGQGTNTPAPTPPPTPSLSKDQIATISKAQEEYQAANMNSQQISSMAGAVQNYVKQNPNGQNTNGIMGTDVGLKIRQALFGDTSGQTLQGQSAGAMAGLTESLKGIRNGAVLNRISQALPQTTDGNQVLLQKGAYLPQIATYTANYKKAVKDNLVGGMNQADAEEAADKQVQLPPIPTFGTQAAATQGPAAGGGASVTNGRVYSSSQDVVNAFKSGQIDRATATSILQKQFGMK